MLRSAFRLRWFVLGLTWLFLTNSSQLLSKTEASLPARGTLLESSLLTRYSKEQLDANFQRFGLKARFGVKLYRVSYQTELASSWPKPTQASGLVLIPDVAAPQFPWISLQHGTIAGKAEAPSVSPGEGLFEASQGFVTVVADYLGYGASESLFHPYLIAKAYASSGVDLLRATRKLAAQEQLVLGPLFLKGYSEGGYATLALQKALETRYSDEFTITASAPSAGPYDLEESARIVLSRPISNPLNTAFLILAYDRWLAPAIDLGELFTIDPAVLKELFNGKQTGTEILKALPLETRKFVQNDFLDSFLADRPTSFQAALIRHLLASQSLNRDNWVPRSLTRFYHCAEDEIVPVEATELTVAHFQELKADAPVSAVIASSPDSSRPYTHVTCPFIFAPVSWFGEILSQP